MHFLKRKYMGASPLVSVLLPVYNSEDYVSLTIESVLQQSLSNFELIIIDDGSTDRTSEIINSFKDSRIRYIKNPTNLKLIETLNKGISLATCELIARIDSDDLMRSDRLERQYNFMSKNINIDVVGTDFFIIDKKDTVKKRLFMPSSPKDINYYINLFCPIAHPTVMFRKSKILASGGYSIKNLHVEDFALWKRVNNSNNLANIPEPLNYIRKHANNVTRLHNTVHDSNRLSLLLASFCLPEAALHLVQSPQDKKNLNKTITFLRTLPSTDGWTVDTSLYLWGQGLKSIRLFFFLASPYVLKSFKLKSYIYSLIYKVVSIKVHYSRKNHL